MTCSYETAGKVYTCESVFFTKIHLTEMREWLLSDGTGVNPLMFYGQPRDV